VKEISESSRVAVFAARAGPFLVRAPPLFLQAVRRPSWLLKIGY
jgi:hypothetical protein